MSIKKEKISGKMIEVSIKSTSLSKASYDALKENLRVEFVNGGIYEYEQVSSQTFTKFRLAKSQGKFFNESISKKYKYKKVRTI
jgi:hypothetical protein